MKIKIDFEELESIKYKLEDIHDCYNHIENHLASIDNILSGHELFGIEKKLTNKIKVLDEYNRNEIKKRSLEIIEDIERMHSGFEEQDLYNASKLNK